MKQKELMKVKQKEFEYEFDDIHINRFVELNNNIENISKSKNKKVLILFILLVCLLFPYKQLDFDGTKQKDYLFYGETSKTNSITKIVVSLDKDTNDASITVNDFEGNQTEAEIHILKKIIVLSVFIIATIATFLIYALRTFFFKQRVIDDLKIDGEEKRDKGIRVGLKSICGYITEKESGEKWYTKLLLIDYSLSNFLKHKDLKNENYENFNSKYRKDKLYWYTYKDFKKSNCLIPVKESLLNRINKKFILESNNWCNLKRTICLMFIVIFINFLIMTGILKGFLSRNIMNIITFEELLISFLLIYIMVRIFSRGSEIAIAFYKDIVRVNSKIFFYSNHSVDSENEKTNKYITGFAYKNNHYSSLLRRSSRLSLAIHSLFEIILLYAMAYWLVFYLLIDSSSSFIATLLFSFSISAFNFSFMSYDFLVLTILHISQVGLSMVLILLSIAQYLNNENLTKQEEEFYYNVTLHKYIYDENKKNEAYNDSRYYQTRRKLEKEVNYEDHKNEVESKKILFERLKSK
ncbi:hypothetical protein [Lysinibacillus fusiformis]|uniref:hypothetical protein n=1 Tax=Lysinibacillus fusiformis TaxID=28031 RepID=UPI0030192E7D